ncbi:MAG: hypothetical protein ACREFB_06665, partial [Stellaceae bacterium]
VCYGHRQTDQGAEPMKAFWIAAALVVVIAVFAIFGWRYFCGAMDAGVFGGIVGGLITAIATLALIWLGIKQLQGLANTANADFVLRRADKFFQSETRVLLHLIEDNYLLFKEKTPLRNSYFLLDEQKIKCLHEDIKNKFLKKRVYSTYEIDDLILGPLEDIATLEEKNRISFDLIYDFFSWYISRVWENSEIQRYVHAARKEREGGGDIYEGLEKLAKRCKQEEERREK